MADADQVPVPLEGGEVAHLPPHETVVIEVGERDYWRDGTRYRQGELLEVPAYAVRGIVGATPPYGRVVSDLEAATAPDAEEDDADEPEPIEERDEDEDSDEL